MIAWWMAVAMAGSSLDLLTKIPKQVDGEAVVNWSRMRVEVRVLVDPAGTAHSRGQAEQAAADRAMEQMAVVARAVGVRDGLTLDEIDGFERPISQGLRVVQVDYFARDVVAVTSAMDLRPLLERWMRVRAADPPLLTVPPGPSGVVIDTRGLHVEPCYAPTLLGPDGARRYDSVLWANRVATSTPVVWVADPTEEVTIKTVGYDPLLMIATQAQGCTITLSPKDAATWDAKVAGTVMMGEGAVVVVVDR